MMQSLLASTLLTSTEQQYGSNFSLIIYTKIRIIIQQYC